MDIVVFVTMDSAAPVARNDYHATLSLFHLVSFRIPEVIPQGMSMRLNKSFPLESQSSQTIWATTHPESGMSKDQLSRSAIVPQHRRMPIAPDRL